MHTSTFDGFSAPSCPLRRRGRLIRSLLALAIAGGDLAVHGVAQADWPQFRGPDGCGDAGTDGLPTRWSETDNIAWKTPIAGLAWSSPVVRGGRIFLTTAVPLEEPEASRDQPAGGNPPPDGAGGPPRGPQSLGLLCLDAASGREVWRRELFRQTAGAAIHKKNSHASPTPVIQGDRIYTHFGPHGTACVTLAGEVLWKRTIPYSPTHGNGGSPALAGNTLVICCDGSDEQFVVGLDTNSGQDRWRTPRDTSPAKGFSFATPLVCDVAGSTQVVCPGSDAVFAYDPATGSERWRVDYPGGYSVTPRPVFGCGLVYVSSGYDKPVLYAIDPSGRGNVTESHVRWRMDRAAPLTPSVVVVGDELYCVADNGVATCLDARSGVEHWRERLGGNFSASPLHAGGIVYFQDENGTAILVRAAKHFEELGRSTVGDGDRTFASYAVVDRSLLIRSESALYRVGR
jgi:outer membrane protein assembly factor BamB